MRSSGPAWTPRARQWRHGLYAEMMRPEVSRSEIGDMRGVRGSDNVRPYAWVKLELRHPMALLESGGKR